MTQPASKPPIINCHAHIFTGDHVPPRLARSVVVSPLHYLLNFQWIFAAFRWYYNGPGKNKYGGVANDKHTRLYQWNMFIRRNPLLNKLQAIIRWYATIQALHIILRWFVKKETLGDGWFGNAVLSVYHFLLRIHVIEKTGTRFWQIVIVVAVFLLFKSSRNLLLFALKQTVSLFQKIPGKETRKLFDRYLTIGRYTFHREQGKTLNQLQSQYPKGTGFVILPMDMEFMGAGKPPESYTGQMRKIADLKKKGEPIYPFVFIDPRRIAMDAEFFKYKIVGEQVVLEDCFVREYIETNEFSGFKIYPALGYFPFDPLLLPLWKYAEQNNLPILTHCVRGPMYYRGSKEKNWDFHPVFKQSSSVAGDLKSLLLPELKNDEFTANFTHPLNFAVLLKDEFLAPYLAKLIAEDPSKKELGTLFGLTENKSTDNTITYSLTRGLKDLKICLGHYGGNDEWNRYLESDRYSHNNELAQSPDTGIDFLHLKDTQTPAPGKPEQIWKYADWYSIISSLILQHKNVYADISYILHSDAQILPLLKQSLQNPGLRQKILYGTDFFVVRNHKSDKNMLADMMGGLEEADFDEIARCNPISFLSNVKRSLKNDYNFCQFDQN